MKAYSATSGNVNGAFPVTAAKNSSTGVSTDGTPWVQDYVNDFWALLQGLMDRVGMSPSGTVEVYTVVGAGSAAGLGQSVADTAQQHLASFARNFGSPGELVFDQVNTWPTRRVLPLQGQVVDGYLYPDLWYATWVRSGANGTATAFYTTSDAGGVTRATTGLTVNGVTGGRYLVLPDYRGLSPIGLGVNAKWGTALGLGALAPTGGATLGAYLADKMQGHYHSPLSGWTSFYGASGTGSFSPAASLGNGAITTGPATSDGTNGTPRVGLYTNGPGFATNIGIRY